jgi:transposase
VGVGGAFNPAGQKRGGKKRTVDIRAVVNGLMYVLSTGCQWRAIPKDSPHSTIIHVYFRRWTDDRTLDRLHQALYVRLRELAVRVDRFSNSLADGRSLAALKYYFRALSRP